MVSVPVPCAVPAAEADPADARRVAAGALREAEEEAAPLLLRAVFFVFFSMSVPVSIFLTAAGAGGEGISGKEGVRAKE